MGLDGLAGIQTYCFGSLSRSRLPPLQADPLSRQSLGCFLRIRSVGRFAPYGNRLIARQRSLRTGGLTTQVAQVALNDGLYRVGLNRIVAIAICENGASTRIMENLEIRYQSKVIRCEFRVAVYSIDKKPVRSRPPTNASCESVVPREAIDQVNLQDGERSENSPQKTAGEYVPRTVPRGTSRLQRRHN